MDSTCAHFRNEVVNVKCGVPHPHNNILFVITYRCALSCKKSVLYQAMMSRENKIIIHNVCSS